VTEQKSIMSVRLYMQKFLAVCDNLSGINSLKFVTLEIGTAFASLSVSFGTEVSDQELSLIFLICLLSRYIH
jgi:hypothetical protein